MTGLQAFLQRHVRLRALADWRGIPLIALLAVILYALPEARVLLAAGFAGGVVLGVLMILVGHRGPNRPDRGTPVVLFPRPAIQARGMFGTTSLMSAA